MKNSEQELIRLARKGNKTAYTELAREVEGKLFALLYRLSGNREDARDLLQQVLVKGYVNIKKFRGDSAFYTWMYRIALHHAYRELDRGAERLRQRSDSINAPTGEGLLEKARDQFVSRQESPRLLAERRERIELVRRTIAGLPEKFFDVAVLYHVEALSYEEISDTIGISIGTVMSRLHRANKRLFKQLAPYREKL